MTERRGTGPHVCAIEERHSSPVDGPARIGIGLTRAYVSDASLTDLAGVAVSATAGMVRPGGDGG